jgi:hypothetical protein
MPSKKYIITVLDGPLGGCEFIKYSRCEADDVMDVDGLDILDCNYQVEIIELHQ